MQPKEVQQILNETPNEQVFYKNNPVIITNLDMESGKVVVENLNTKKSSIVHSNTLTK
ncbi:small, acid-soluble spore protein, H family [Oceanirhabdus sp. W0125-5]|uniref:small, acid-soluble spore protein, H family n=1 Tax=Oceanirhabdus sp. W0125-5 TaxID=2999116 RepID=UPI0022F3450C|nr:small, acid-soluble spore protein, H family [Oceanirhabdus sp. W0125-5]WBW96970.1 small, acid-soluble spore protein, H family [Oceanirhabdus sp. W0125-5]